MKYLIIIFSSLILFSLSCLSRQPEKEITLRIFDGYIIQDDDNINTYYLQDMESADLIELKFIYDDFEELSFDEFKHVEVIGQYNETYNFLVVDQILDTRELIVLDPVN